MWNEARYLVWLTATFTPAAPHVYCNKISPRMKNLLPIYKNVWTIDYKNMEMFWKKWKSTHIQTNVNKTWQYVLVVLFFRGNVFIYLFFAEIFYLTQQCQKNQDHIQIIMIRILLHSLYLHTNPYLCYNPLWCRTQLKSTWFHSEPMKCCFHYVNPIRKHHSSAQIILMQNCKIVCQKNRWSLFLVSTLYTEG